MNYRRLGKTGLMVSEIGLGAEWLERHTTEECIELVSQCEAQGINILDCWMSEPNVRTRELDQVKIAFEDLLTRLDTDYIDLGMIHYVDQESDWETIVNGPFLTYVQDLKARGTIRHIAERMARANEIFA